ncbi:hypothetical protein ACR6C2_39945 [Streptomyces sp. INA 01156]
MLDTVAKDRQVIVFTHDTRLQQAISHLGIRATVLRVTRQTDSVVGVETVTDPVDQALAEARAISLDPWVPQDVADRVLPAMCRVLSKSPVWSRHAAGSATSTDCRCPRWRSASRPWSAPRSTRPSPCWGRKAERPRRRRRDPGGRLEADRGVQLRYAYVAAHGRRPQGAGVPYQGPGGGHSPLRRPGQWRAGPGGAR